MFDNRNLTMMTDLYQLTMMNSYYLQGVHQKKSVFDMFYRQSSTYVSYSIFAGLEQVVDYIQKLKFTDEDLEYLKSLNLFDGGFLEYLKDFKFTGSIYSMKEGSVVFPQEVLIRVEANLIEAQLIETAILNMINFQTLIASKSSHIVNAGKGRVVSEFGLRRAQGADAGFYGARAAYIGGADATSNVLAAKAFNIPVTGTLSHSYIMSFDCEYEAFMTYAKTYPDNCVLLIDTYNTLKSGLPNAIKVFKHLKEQGHKPMGVRIDSGDLSYLSKKVREALDENGFEQVKICASGDLDEDLIVDLLSQGAKIDIWGVGTKLITAFDNPALGGVYKMSAIEKDGEMTPKMKVSDNVAKTTNPGIKKVYRFYDKKTGDALLDLIALIDETIDETKPLRVYHPIETWKSVEVSDFYVKELLIPVIINGECVYDLPTIEEIRKFREDELEGFWEEYKRHTKPQKYKVDLSDKLYDLKKKYLILC